MNKIFAHILQARACVVDQFFPLDKKFLYTELLGQKVCAFLGFFFFIHIAKMSSRKIVPIFTPSNSNMSADFPSPMPTLSIIILFNHCQSDQQQKKVVSHCCFNLPFFEC